MNTVKNIAIKSLLQGIGITAVLILFTNVFYSQSITSSERGTVTYRIIAHKANETAIVSTSNTAILKKSTSLFMPTAFTPDSDGINDQFGAKGINVRDFSPGSIQPLGRENLRKYRYQYALGWNLSRQRCSTGVVCIQCDCL